MNNLLHEILPYITPILTFIFGTALYIDISRRKKLAEAKKAEADNITAYAAEWKELYEKKENRVNELDVKIDKLYESIESYRAMVRKLRDENFELKQENMKLTYHRCDVRGCTKRQPPSEMMN